MKNNLLKQMLEYNADFGVFFGIFNTNMQVFISR